LRHLFLELFCDAHDAHTWHRYRYSSISRHFKWHNTGSFRIN